jgi:hypothetical protein
MAEILGAFEQAVLLAILRLGEDAYGRAILKEVQVRLKRDVAAGAVHSTLERLAKKEAVGHDDFIGCSLRDCAHSTIHGQPWTACGAASVGL